MATPNFKSSYENKYGPSVLLLRRKVIRPKTPASFVSSSLTTRVSLLSLSDKPTVDVMGHIWTTLLGLSVLRAPSRRLRRPVDFGVVEWDVLCATEASTTTTPMGVNREQGAL